MGHFVTYMEFSKKATRADMFAARARVLEDNGERDNGYLLSSDSGFKLHSNTIYNSREEAREAIAALDNGWYDDHGVLFRDYSKVKPTKAMISLMDKISEIYDKKAEYIKKNDVHNRTSDTITCPKCKSRLSLAYLNGNICPLCRTDLRSDTVKNRIKAFDSKIKECEKKYAELEKKQDDKAEIKWLVKLEFHV